MFIIIPYGAIDVSIRNRRLPLLLTLALVLPGLILLLSPDEAIGEDTDLMLYMTNSGGYTRTLRTHETTTTAGDLIASGTTAEYNMEYPFARSLFISGSDGQRHAGGAGEVPGCT